MVFFNFTNQPTFHFFWWATSGGLDVALLVASAFESAEANAETDEGVNAFAIARDRLAHLLKEACMEHLGIDEASDLGWPGEPAPVVSDPDRPGESATDDLTYPLMAWPGRS